MSEASALFVPLRGFLCSLCRPINRGVFSACRCCFAFLLMPDFYTVISVM